MPSSQGLADVFSFLGKGLQSGADRDLKERQLKINQGMLAVQKRQIKLRETAAAGERKLNESEAGLKNAQKLSFLINAVGGTIKDKAELDKINELFPELTNFWSKEYKENQPTGKFLLHHPDVITQKSKEQEAQIKADRQKLADTIKQEMLGLNKIRTRLAELDEPRKVADEARRKQKHDVFMKEGPTFETAEGIQRQSRTTGELTTIAQPKPPETPANVKTKMIELRSTISALDDIEATWEKSYTGIIKGGFVGSVMSTLQRLPEEEEAFRTKVNNFKNLYVTAMSGGTIPVEEWARWLEAIPNMKDPAKRFLPKLRVMRNNTKALLKKYESGFKQDPNKRYELPRLSSGLVDLSALSPKELKAYKLLIEKMED